MNYAEYARYCRLIGYHVQETAHGIWIGISKGFFNRVPLHETLPPAEEEMHSLFRRYPILGLHYALASGSKGTPSHVYFVRDREYDLKDLHPSSRRGVRRGLENCQVRRMGFDELHRLGMPLNRDTLERQGRDDPVLSNPRRWTCLCQAGERVAGAQAWGAFAGDELAAYVMLFRTGKVVNVLYQNSCTSLMKLYANPALNFTVTQTMMRTPGIEAVYNGPGGQWSSKGLDDYKRRMGFHQETVNFAVRLRPAVERLLLSRGGRCMISVLGRWLRNNHSLQQVQAILDTATLSL